jgi:hypothetical protein
MSVGYIKGQCRVLTLLAILSLGLDNGVNVEQAASEAGNIL